MPLLRCSLIAALALAAACGDNLAPPAAALPPEVALVPAAAGSDVDVLFVVYNTGGEFQDELENSFPELVSVLGARPAGLPNLHIGVVSSDLGTSSVDDPPAPDVPGCHGAGQGGDLAKGMFLSDVAGPGGTRVTNYSGPIQDAFTDLASLGNVGCGFRQPIEAAVRALVGNPLNAGFRRPDAALAIVIVGDEDDCSLANGQLVTSDTSVLGPFQTFRCVRYGVTCQLGGLTPDAMSSPGPKVDCGANEQSPYLASVRDAAAQLQALAPDPRDVLAAAIAGDPTPVAVELRPPQAGAQPIPAVAQSCSYVDSSGGTVEAGPGIRIADFLDHFRHHAFGSVCAQDLGPALDPIALEIGNLLGDPCVPVAVRDPSSCEAFDEGPGGATPVQLSACGGGTAADCFTVAPDAAACPLGAHLALHVTRAQPAAPGTMTSLRCTP